MKRILIIIGIILLITAIVVLGIWLLGRRSATQEGGRALTFREFITGESATTTPDGQSNGSLGAVFTDPSQVQTDPLLSPDSTAPANPTAPRTVATSVFTNDTSLSPSTGGGQSILDPVLIPGNGLGGGSVTTTTTTTTTTTDIIPGTSTIAFSGCSEADQNIPFTAQELSDLRGLQNRFYEVATRLHTDADVSAEIANLSNFKTKVDKILELDTFCANNIAKLNPQMKRTVPTPFWRNPATDSLAGYFTILPNLPNTGFLANINFYGGEFDLGDVAKSKRNLELALRLSLW